MSGDDKKATGSSKPSKDGAKKVDISKVKLDDLLKDPVALQALTDPSAMGELSQKLASVINASMQPNVPYPVRRRIRALKNCQLTTTKLEQEFYKEVQQLEAKYQDLYQPHYDKRRDIIVGSHEPTDEESAWSDESDEEDKTPDDQTSGTNGDSSEADKGVALFWITALKNCELFTESIKEHDEPVLEHLTDLKVVYADAKGLDFSIEYHFSENEWFSNKVLVKSYTVSCEVDTDDPWSFEGAAITACTGCKIDWKKGKNLTIKTIKKKQKRKGKQGGKGGGQAQVVTKTVPNESFFTQFSPPDPEAQSPDESEEDIAQTLSDDFSRAEFIRDRLVPKAVLFYTGEALEEDEDQFDEDEFDDEDEEASGEDDYDPQQDVNQAKPSECKQQ